MSRISSPLIAAVGAISLASCAPTSGTDTTSNITSNDQCFHPRQTSNFRGNNETFYLLSQDKYVFELKTIDQCPEIDFNLPPIFRSPSTYSRVCTGDTSIIEMSRLGMRSLCRVQVVKKLTDDEIAALPAQDRPPRK